VSPSSADCANSRRSGRSRRMRERTRRPGHGEGRAPAPEVLGAKTLSPGCAGGQAS